MKLIVSLRAKFLAVLAILPIFFVSAPAYAASTTISGSCSGGDFLFFPTWYKYLPGKIDSTGLCSPQLGSLSDVWLIVAAVIELLLRVAAIVAVVMVIWGAVGYISSQGEPEKTNKARDTIINALVGLLLSVMAAVFINFVARSIT